MSPHCFCPCCCLPLLLLLPSAEIFYNAALAGSSAAAFSAVDAPLLYWLLTLLAAAAVLTRGGMRRFLSLFLPPPFDVYWPWCCTGIPQSTKLARYCNTGTFLLSLYWCVEWPGFVS